MDDPKSQSPYAPGYPVAPQPPPPGYSPSSQQPIVVVPGAGGGEMVAYQQPDGSVGYVIQPGMATTQQSGQVIVVTAPPPTVVVPVRKSASETFQERAKAPYGVFRIIQALLSVVLFGLLCGLMAQDPWRTGYYWIWLLIAPLCSFATALSQLFVYSARSWAYGGGGDIGYGILYILELIAVACIYFVYFLWGSIFANTVTTLFHICNTIYAFCGIMTLIYWVVGCSACCCHCLDFNLPPP